MERHRNHLITLSEFAAITGIQLPTELSELLSDGTQAWQMQQIEDSASAYPLQITGFDQNQRVHSMVGLTSDRGLSISTIVNGLTPRLLIGRYAPNGALIKIGVGVTNNEFPEPGVRHPGAQLPAQHNSLAFREYNQHIISASQALALSPSEMGLWTPEMLDQTPEASQLLQLSSYDRVRDPHIHFAIAKGPYLGDYGRGLMVHHELESGRVIVNQTLQSSNFQIELPANLEVVS